MSMGSTFSSIPEKAKNFKHLRKNKQKSCRHFCRVSFLPTRDFVQVFGWHAACSRFRAFAEQIAHWMLGIIGT
jgi:hypothetical protein